jgi:hypothetical protein
VDIWGGGEKHTSASPSVVPTECGPSATPAPSVARVSARRGLAWSETTASQTLFFHASLLFPDNRNDRIHLEPTHTHKVGPVSPSFEQQTNSYVNATSRGNLVFEKQNFSREQTRHFIPSCRVKAILRNLRKFRHRVQQIPPTKRENPTAVRLMRTGILFIPSKAIPHRTKRTCSRTPQRPSPPSPRIKPRLRPGTTSIIRRHHTPTTIRPRRTATPGYRRTREDLHRHTDHPIHPPSFQPHREPITHLPRDTHLPAPRHRPAVMVT